ncbi:MAG TPA: hypothetical protein VE959_13285 [Bryobacteraceae bacterium]|nr:hypothetical protein [Bryobacteraceae bacterium]
MAPAFPRVLAALALVPLAMAQRGVTRENGRWVRTITGSAPATAQLRVNAHGPVTLEGGVSQNLSYVIKISVYARTEAEALRRLSQYAVQVEPQGRWTVLNAPGGADLATMALKAPRLSAAVIATSEGAVEAGAIEGTLEVNSRAGELTIGRVGGNCTLSTGGGEIKVGEIGGSLHCTTRAGAVTVKAVRSDAAIGTNGGDIAAGQVGGSVRAETGGGDIHVGTSGGTVNATSGGGKIVVDSAGGTVTVHNMAGPVQVGSAAGVRCESGSGGIRVSNISGPMRVSTSMGSILATLLSGRISESYLATGNGDITVWIPSNVGVTIQAQNNMADTLRRIISEFSEIPVRREGTQVIAQGSVNGGGPLVQIVGMGGTIFIKRQK